MLSSILILSGAYVPGFNFFSPERCSDVFWLTLTPVMPDIPFLFTVSLIKLYCHSLSQTIITLLVNNFQLIINSQF